MTRSLDAATQSASESPVILPAWFVKLEFDGGDVCLHTGAGELAFGGDTYVGAGGIGSIGQVDEDSELSRSTLELSLRGLPQDIVAIALGEHYQGRPATLSLGYLDRDTRQLVAAPIVLYRGRMDAAALKQGETFAVTLTVESRFAAWDRPVSRRYNNSDQQSRYPGDTGLQFVEQSTEKQIVWGRRYAG